MLANGRLLVGGDLLPVLGDEAGSLDGGLLTKVDILVGADDLDEEEEGLGLGVEVLLELGSDGLDSLRVGWVGKSQVSDKNPRGKRGESIPTGGVCTYESGSLGAG